MLLEPKELYKFGKFQLDIAERLLTNGSGKRLPLSDNAFETLCILVKNAGRLVAKNDLMDQVWKDSFVEENNLDKCIHAIRRALGEKPGEQKFIETVRRHGYRFVADVNRIEPSVPNRTDLIPQNGTSKTSESKLEDRAAAVRLSPDFTFVKHRPSLANFVAKWRRPLVTGIAAAAIFGIGLGLYFLLSNPNKQLNDNYVKIAVLPLKPIDSQNRSEIYEIGIADSLINKINSMKGVFARPLNAVRKYTDLSQDALSAGKEQQVEFVLAANYQLAENRIRITWQLINVLNGQVEETQTFESSSGDLFAKQDAVAANIGNQLAKRFVTTFRSNAAKRGTENEEAYRLYLQGMYLYDRRTSADAQRAVEKLSQAIELDRGYAQAWAGKAHAHRSLGNFGGSRSPHDEYRKSIDAVNNALALDGNLSDAYSALCENKFFYEYDYEGAERECKRAIELDPNSYLAHEIYARCLWTLSRFDDAIAEVKLAIDIEPTSLFSQRNYGISLFYARRYDEAVHQFKRVSDMDANFVANYAWFVPALLVQGSKEEAFEAFIKWQILMKADESALQQYRLAYRSDGWPGVGRERVKRFDEDKIRSYFLEACLTAHTGDKDKTFEYLEKSLDRREWGIPFLWIDPSLDDIRKDSRFADIAKRVVVKKTI